MLILGIDLETTGLRTDSDFIIEIGAATWDTERGAALQLYSQLVRPGVTISAEITKITGITNEDLDTYGAKPFDALNALYCMAMPCACIVAHNGTQFDRPLLEAEYARRELEPPKIPWIDTSLDVPYPEHIKTRTLTHLAAEHGFLNPFAHRALSDVLTMLQVLANYDINRVLELSQEPKLTLAARVKKPWLDTAVEGKKETDLAKARGYRFNGESKRWQKIVRQSELRSEQSHGEFVVKIVET